ncbi:MAG TPA: hypothetical protein VGQ59_19315 [Cyclobacteriaceae bacterium]|nr:hypothetical protein [Cyclobacteriaceae bacterium]
MTNPFWKKTITIIFAIIYLISLLWLSSVWYNTYTGFHFFDDLFEWEYMDKLGHFFSSFHLGLFFYKIFGNPNSLNQSIQKKWFCFSGFVLLLPIEILDGFSLNYGASPADLLANGLGGLFCYCHVTYKVLSDTLPKFSFHTTALNIIRPELLGCNIFQQAIKDYNGQTYWLSLDVNKVLNAKILPSWLMLTIGYGADGLLGGHDTEWENKNGETKDYSTVARTKRFFISIDINANSLREKNKLLNYLLAPFALLKFPAPALEINFERGIVFHPIYF